MSDDDNDWSFSYLSRRSARYDSDSGSESDGEKTMAGTATATSNSAFNDDFDLASRKDDATVTYKPNPFSIAKINAACRAQKAAATTTPVLQRPAGPPIRPAARSATKEKQKSLKSTGSRATAVRSSITPFPDSLRCDTTPALSTY